jgi:Domain of unknown function (DUF4383)
MSTTTPSLSSSPNRIIGTLFGAVYLLVGIIGFFWSTGTAFASPSVGGGHAIFGLFEVNPLHNVLHLIVGAALLIAGVSTASAAKATNTTIAVIYLLLGVVGFFLAAPDNGDSALNFLSLNTPDHFLHLASGLVLLVTGVGADKRARASRPAVA